ncbi:hypothetical protein COLO4_37462 [Corchorus olitorius]|uniref:RNase H type-1 domain-containing protein n=1 Tax=Corchorus olitorius TaxID=93759 RepID=A0A1R3G1K9_9ROSI|nr:hypothetical protein COLO4_37462 [Corchorus olitorius]
MYILLYVALQFCNHEIFPFFLGFPVTSPAAARKDAMEYWRAAVMKDESLMVRGSQFPWGGQGAGTNVVFFATTCWRIWCRRCRYAFEDELPTDSSDGLAYNIAAKEICDVTLKPPRNVLINKLIHWIPPQDMIVKLNTDGASRGNPRVTGADGLIRIQWEIGWLVF